MATATTEAPVKAEIKEVRAFFEEGTGSKLGAPEIMRLKKNEDGVALPDYGQIATGIGDGSLHYEATEEQIAAAKARHIPVPSTISV